MQLEIWVPGFVIFFFLCFFSFYFYFYFVLGKNMTNCFCTWTETEKLPFSGATDTWFSQSSDPIGDSPLVIKFSWKVFN